MNTITKKKPALLAAAFIMATSAITSVLGAAYTSVSFLKTLRPFIKKYERLFICGFIFTSTVLLVVLGSAKRMILMAGAVNGFVLPISLFCILFACGNKRIAGSEYDTQNIINNVATEMVSEWLEDILSSASRSIKLDKLSNYKMVLSAVFGCGFPLFLLLAALTENLNLPQLTD